MVTSTILVAGVGFEPTRDRLMKPTSYRTALPRDKLVGTPTVSATHVVHISVPLLVVGPRLELGILPYQSGLITSFNTRLWRETPRVGIRDHRQERWRQLWPYSMSRIMVGSGGFDGFKPSSIYPVSSPIYSRTRTPRIPWSPWGLLAIRTDVKRVIVHADEPG